MIQQSDTKKMQFKALCSFRLLSHFLASFSYFLTKLDWTGAGWFGPSSAVAREALGSASVSSAGAFESRPLIRVKEALSGSENGSAALAILRATLAACSGVQPLFTASRAERALATRSSIEA